MIEQLQLLTSFWLDWQIRGLVFSVVVLLLIAPIHMRSPVWKHWALIAGALVLILFPVFLAVLPNWEIAMIPTAILVDPFAAPIAFEYPDDGSDRWAYGLLLSSGLISAFVVVRYLRSVRFQQNKLERAVPMSDDLDALFNRCVAEVGIEHRNPKLVTNQTKDTPCTLGFFRPLVMVPADAENWNPEDVRIVMIHELLHVKRHDWLWQQCLVVAVFLYPLNPFVWKVKRLARAYAEESVDKLSLNLGIRPMKYADALLSQLRNCRQISSSVAVHLHQRLDIRDRVNSLISEPYSWPNMQAWNYAQIFLLALLLAAPIGLVQPTTYSVERYNRVTLVPAVPTEQQPQETAFLPAALPTDIRFPERAKPIVDPESPPGAAYTFATYTEQPEVLGSAVPAADAQAQLSYREIPVLPLPAHLEMPVYPSLAIRRGWESTVHVAFDLNDSGDVVNPRVVSSGSKGARHFESAALNAITASRYYVQDPAGQAYIKNDLTQTYIFELVDDERVPLYLNQTLNPP